MDLEERGGSNHGDPMLQGLTHPAHASQEKHLPGQASGSGGRGKAGAGPGSAQAVGNSGRMGKGAAKAVTRG